MLNQVGSLLSRINSARKQSRNNFVVIPYSKKHLPILRFLANEGIILSFLIFNFYIIIKFKAYTPRIIYRPKRLISLKQLKVNRITHREGGGIGAYVLLTDLGVISSLQAIGRQIGGKFVSKII